MSRRQVRGKSKRTLYRGEKGKGKGKEVFETSKSLINHAFGFIRFSCAQFNFWHLIQGIYKVQLGDIIVFDTSDRHIAIAMKQGLVKSHWQSQIGGSHAILELNRLLERDSTKFGSSGGDRLVLMREMRFLRQVPITL